MKWPNFLKFKFPDWRFGLKLPAFFKPSTSFYRAWKKFIWQIPPDSRSIIKSYQHFVVLGAEKSGKSELIQGLIEQSQDLYPFDTTYTELPDIQFYIGPRQVIEEVSFSTLENRSIRGRKQIIRLWKKLFARTTPLVIVTYDCRSTEDLREMNRLAQLIAGKVSLLTEINKKPIKLRVALTHLDKIPGYLEFARFMKQQNLTFTIPLSSDFESNMLSSRLKAFAEEYLSLSLTSVSYAEHAKIVQFFKEMPQIFPRIEEFLRVLVSRVSFKNSVELDYLSLTSNQEGSTSFPVFQWTKTPSMTLFFRYPMLKHQVAASLLYGGAALFLFSAYFQKQAELTYVSKGVELLNLLQFPAFYNEIVAKYPEIGEKDVSPVTQCLQSSFFTYKLQAAKEQLAHRIRKHIIEPASRKTILENKGEFKYVYFLGLMRATADNHLGKFIDQNADKWGDVLEINPNLIRTYVFCSSSPASASLLKQSVVNPSIPLASLDPWFAYLKKVKEIAGQPIFIEQPFGNDAVTKETEKLLGAVGRMRGDPLVFAIATLLDESGFNESENIKTIHWIGENIDALETFLLFIKQTSAPHLQVQGMNLTQFYAKLKELACSLGTANELYNFTLRDQLFTFDSQKWTGHIVVHNIERTIQEYIALHSETNGSIFFNHTVEIPDFSVVPITAGVSFFRADASVPGRFSRRDFELKVRSPAEKLVSFIESLPINPEEKKRFSSFLVREAVDYIQSYQGRYTKLFDSYEMEVSSAKEIKKLLEDLSKPTSSFYEFLRAVHYQTSGFSQSWLSMENPGNLNEFAFLDQILQHKDGKAPIEEYQKLMKELLQDLDKSISSGFAPASLQPCLTSNAQISLSMLRQNPDSYAVKLEQCLSQMGVPERFYPTFKKPLLLVYQFGLQELKTAVESAWTSIFEPKIGELLDQFPFNFQGSTVATLEAVEEVFNPTSKFYREFQEAVSLLSAQKEGTWFPVEREIAGLSERLYAQLNRVSHLANLLWDAEGKPKPLEVKMSSVPFNLQGIRYSVPALCYIVAGGESMYNFNQDPSWQTLSIEWWKPESSYIGMEILNKGNKTKSYRNLHEPASPWSFFSLIRQGKREEGNRWEWGLPGKDGKETRTISFCFENNPEQIFQPKAKI